MAAAPLNAPLSQPQDPALQELLAKLDPNILPTEPSGWPLPVGYWLILAVLVLATAAVWYVLYKTKMQRQLKAEIKRIALYPQAQQTIAAHKLLRWVSIHLGQQPRSLNEKQFADFIVQRCGALPVWFNTHYSNQEPSPINWPELTLMIKQLSRRSAT